MQVITAGHLEASFEDLYCLKMIPGFECGGKRSGASSRWSGGIFGIGIIMGIWVAFGKSGRLVY